jgi:FKBP-type peptidyl-prolyl cis-trans isomerase
MSDQVQTGERSPSEPTSADAGANARRRARATAGALAGVAVVAVLVAVFVGVRVAGDDGPASPAAAAMPSQAPASEAPPSEAPPQDAQQPQAVQPPPALAKRPAVRPGGSKKLTRLKVTSLVRGTGPKVKAGQQITVNYVLASYKTGEELQASWDNGRPLEPFQIGSGAVIKGFDEGLVGVRVGSRVQLDIPANLAYGDPAPEGRPSGDLRFIVDVLAAQ